MSRITLLPRNLHWIDGSANNSADLCAHAGVEFRIDDTTLIKPEDGDWTVSAAAMHLLRTLTQRHSGTERVAEHLFPRRGAIFEVDNSDDVVIIGCNRGIDFEVIKVGPDVLIRGNDGRPYQVPSSDWKRAVFEFCDAVDAFYAVSLPGTPENANDARSYRKFWAEWYRRRLAGEAH